MPSYIVKEPLKHNGKSYAPGESVEMDAKGAKELLLLGVVAEGADKSEAKGKGK